MSARRFLRFALGLIGLVYRLIFPINKDLIGYNDSNLFVEGGRGQLARPLIANSIKCHLKSLFVIVLCSDSFYGEN